MSVSGISSSSGLTSADWQSKAQQVKADYSSLADALKSGNLSDAQQAFAALQQDLPPRAQAAAADSSTPLGALGNALQTGDLAGAQKAFASLQQARQGHHHHHAAAASAAVTSPTSNDGDADDSTGQSLNAVA
jgi:hypothetical protein